MPAGGLADRIAILEKIVGGPGGIGEHVAALTGEVTRLNGGVDDLRTQFLAFRSDTAAEFAAVRGEMKAEFGAVREEMRTEFAAVREEMRTEFAMARSEMAVEFTRIKEEIKSGDDETRRQMRVLHEDVVARIALLQEGLNGRSRSRRPRKT